MFLVSCTQDWNAAERFADKLVSAMEKLAEFPGMGIQIKGTKNSQYRRFLLESKYWICYTYDESTLTVWRVLHTKQDLDDFAIVDW